MILTHGANSIKRGLSVEIGGKSYPVVRIGDQYWTTENLDWAPDGITICSNAWYYDNNEATWGWNGRKCGLYYNGPARVALNSKIAELGNGWRVATNNDFTTLLTYTNQAGTAGNKLKAADKDWYSGWNGTDDYGFNLMPTGDRENRFLYAGSRGFLGFSSTSGIYYGFCCLYKSNDIDVGYHYDSVAFPIRLVKDA